MFPKKNRLPHDAFARVFRTGKRVHTDDFQVIYLTNNLPNPRFAIQVGKKVDKQAVHRNRMKRLLRESIRHLIPDMEKGYDCIFIAKNNFSEKTLKGVSIHISNLFRLIR